MSAIRDRLGRVLRRLGGASALPTRLDATTEPAVSTLIDIPTDDPLLAYCQDAPGPFSVDEIELQTPATEALRAQGTTLVVPLKSQGELVGLLNLGSRLSQQEYSPVDLFLLSNLAVQAAPAVRVAEFVQEQQAEALDRERMEHELQVARLVQQTLLPRQLPQLPGWRFATYYQPARAVGGDFYDFLSLPDGRRVIIIGDVTDKGVPAALVMTMTRTILRAAAQRLFTPAQLLSRANELLYQDIPPNMFVTCQCAIFDALTGELRFANAGHNLPFRHRSNAVEQLRATGVPLGLMPGTTYDETSTVVRPGETLLFYSDGLIEAHDPGQRMFGTPRLAALLATLPIEIKAIDRLLEQLKSFVGPDWEQEDDVTMLTLERLSST